MNTALSRRLTQSNGVATTSYSYDLATLALDTETIAYDFDLDGTADIVRVLDRARDNLNRDTGWQLQNGAAIENQATYGYGTTDGRLRTVSNAAATFTYGYLAGSNLVETLAGPAHTVTNAYEATRNVLDTKTNAVDAIPVAAYDYTVNPIGQRSSVATSGTAFAAAAGWGWAYNERGEVSFNT